MANRPLYNGSARVVADNGQAGALRVSFNFRASKDAIDTGVETVGNASFQAEAGVAVVLNYDVRKYGGGIETGTPTAAFIRVFKDDDTNDARAGADFESADLVGGNPLPRSGTFSFTPTTGGTYRIQLEMQKDNGDFGAASDDWRIISDGSFSRGGVAVVTTAVAQDKGRVRMGMQVTVLEVVRQDGTAPPSGLFAFTTDGTSSVESVRATWTQSAQQNKSTANEVYRTSARRNGTATIDTFASTALLGTTQHRMTRKVALTNYPLGGTSQLYDSVLTVENVSALHSGNTIQYGGLGGAAESGVWTHFTAATAPLTLVDFRTVEKTSSHTVDSGGTVENVFCRKSSVYTEDGAGIPQGAEDVDFVATDENMTTKTGRILNARGEALSGIFIVTTVTHEAGSVQRDQWGQDSGIFKTVANGWQDDAHVTTVSTPPAGIHKAESVAYFPSGTFGMPGNREFSVTRTESGSPAAAGAGKNWIAPASFSNAILTVKQIPQGGDLTLLTLAVFNKDAAVDADSVPTCSVYRGHDKTLFATPTVTKRPATTGIYDASFTPAVQSAGSSDVYTVEFVVAVSGFIRRYGDAVEVMAFDFGENPDRFDPTGLFK